MDTKMIGRRVRAARLATGYNDAHMFARELNYPLTRYEALEDGRLGPRDLDLGVLAEIARLTGKTLDFLVTGKATIAA